MLIAIIDRPFLGSRRMENGVPKEYQWETHFQLKPQIEDFGKGLVSLGLERQNSLGIYSINRREWVMLSTQVLGSTTLTVCCIDYYRACMLS
jgi:long-subunit acyl-CoA synthetase (AMP-forming)